MRALKAIGAAALGLVAGGAVGFVLSELVAILLLVLGGGELPAWAPGLRYLIALFAALGLICAPMLVSRGER